MSKRRAALSPASVEFLKAVASETRLSMLMLFFDHEELSVGQIAGAAKISQSTASQNLSQLRRAGLVVARRAGKETYYRPDSERIVQHLEKLSAFLHCCC